MTHPVTKKRLLAIAHYERAAAELADLPCLTDAAYAALCLRQVDEMLAAVDAGAWRASTLCEPFTHRFIEDAANSSHFVDVGAERGFYAYLARKHLPSGSRILAIEPDPVRYEVLSRRLSRLAHLKVMHAAASDRPGELELTKPRGVSATPAAVEGETFRAPAVVLDELLGDDVPDLVKIDVEGGEAGVLAGMRRILSAGKCRVYLEYHPWVDQVTPGGTALIQSLLAEAGYRMIRVEADASAEVKRPGGRMILLPPGSDPAV